MEEIAKPESQCILQNVLKDFKENEWLIARLPSMWDNWICFTCINVTYKLKLMDASFGNFGYIQCENSDYPLTFEQSQFLGGVLYTKLKAVREVENKISNEKAEKSFKNHFPNCFK